MFEPVTLSWKGEEFTVPAENQMVLIAKVETAIQGDGNRQPLNILMAPEGPTYTQLARGYGAALRHAGATVTDEEIFASLNESMVSDRNKMAEMVQAAIIGLVSLLSPPMGKLIRGEVSEDEKKSNAG